MSSPAAVDLRWIPVDDDGAPSTVRRATTQVCQQIGLSEYRRAEIAIAATELATNTLLHASGGAILLRTRHDGARSSVELVCIDTGPAMEDFAHLLEDGVSSRGTLGIGLGAISRIANRLDAYSVPGRGNVVIAVFREDQTDPATPPGVDGLTRPINGETVCGDAWARHVDGVRCAVILADGLGHGPLAAVAAEVALRCFADGPFDGPATIIDRAHRAMNTTRGAAVSVIDVDLANGGVRFAGIGNVAVRLIDLDRVNGLVPQPGIVGQQMRTVREVSAAAPQGSMIVLHSDGLTSKWDGLVRPTLTGQAPDVVAATLLRDAGIRHDDATVVALRVA